MYCMHSVVCCMLQIPPSKIALLGKEVSLVSHLCRVMHHPHCSDAIRYILDSMSPLASKRYKSLLLMYRRGPAD